MSRRFGRNQKRRMRAELKALEERNNVLLSTVSGVQKDNKTMEQMLTGIIKHLKAINPDSIFLDPEFREHNGKLANICGPPDVTVYGPHDYVPEISHFTTIRLQELYIKIAQDRSHETSELCTYCHFFVDDERKLSYMVETSYLERYGIEELAPHILEILMDGFKQFTKRNKNERGKGMSGLQVSRI